MSLFMFFGTILYLFAGCVYTRWLWLDGDDTYKREIVDHIWILIPFWPLALFYALLYHLLVLTEPVVNQVASYTIKMVDYLLPKSITNKSKEKRND